ncbi:MAG: hypothetical protein GY730_04135 [bacterium]|nr:hypothetical protein [bacterium]
MHKKILLFLITILLFTQYELSASITPSKFSKAYKLRRYAKSTKKRSHINEGQQQKEQHRQEKEPRKDHSYNNYNSSDNSSDNSSSKSLNRYSKSTKSKKHKSSPSYRKKLKPEKYARQRYRGRRFHRKRYHRRHYYGPVHTTYIYNYEKPDTSTPVSTYTPAPEPVLLTEEEEANINRLLDRYEDWQSIFQITAGVNSNLKESAGIYGKQGEFRFNAPYNYGLNGRNFGGWGIGYKGKSFHEEGYSLRSHRLFVDINFTSLNREFASTFGARIGLNTLISDATSAGFLFGLNYALYNLGSFYSFNINYEGTIYNQGSELYDTVLESNLAGYLRFYLSQLHLDTGCEVNFIDIESGNYFYQLFARAGFRF